MIGYEALDQRPIVVAVAGPNGAGKTTFYHAHLESAGLRFVNTDVLAEGLSLDAYAAASLGDALRRQLLKRRESFAFETVLSDPVGHKVEFLREAASAGYTVVFVFIGIASPEIGEERVAMRVSQGGHDVPAAKLRSRFPRTLANLRLAIRELPHVFVFDNSKLDRPYRRVAVFEGGRCVYRARNIPPWFDAPAR